MLRIDLHKTKPARLRSISYVRLFPVRKVIHWSWWLLLVLDGLDWARTWRALVLNQHGLTLVTEPGLVVRVVIGLLPIVFTILILVNWLVLLVLHSIAVVVIVLLGVPAAILWAIKLLLRCAGSPTKLPSLVRLLRLVGKLQLLLLVILTTLIEVGLLLEWTLLLHLLLGRVGVALLGVGRVTTATTLVSILLLLLLITLLAILASGLEHIFAIVIVVGGVLVRVYKHCTGNWHLILRHHLFILFPLWLGNGGICSRLPLLISPLVVAELSVGEGRGISLTLWQSELSVVLWSKLHVDIRLTQVVMLGCSSHWALPEWIVKAILFRGSHWALSVIGHVRCHGRYRLISNAHTIHERHAHLLVLLLLRDLICQTAKSKSRLRLGLRCIIKWLRLSYAYCRFEDCWREWSRLHTEEWIFKVWICLFKLQNFLLLLSLAQI